jgi:hypothetical protein
MVSSVVKVLEEMMKIVSMHLFHVIASQGFAFLKNAIS